MNQPTLISAACARTLSDIASAFERVWEAIYRRRRADRCIRWDAPVVRTFRTRSERLLEDLRTARQYCQRGRDENLSTVSAVLRDASEFSRL